MTVINPATDLLDIYSATTLNVEQGSIAHAVRSALAAGSGLALAFDNTTGLTTITLSGGGSGMAFGGIPYVIPGGTATALTTTIVDVPSAIPAGYLIALQLASNLDLSANPTFQVTNSSTSAAAIKDRNGNAVGTATAGTTVLITFDQGSYWRVLSQLSTTPAMTTYSVIGSYSQGVAIGGTVSINSSYIQFTFTNPLPDTNYTVIGTVCQAASFITGQINTGESPYTVLYNDVSVAALPLVVAKTTSYIRVANNIVTLSPPGGYLANFLLVRTA